jgi:thymidylate kinase
VCGCFIVLVGPDGVGKTSVARALIDEHPGPTGYFHFRPPVRPRLAARPPREVPQKPDKHAPPGPSWMGWSRLAYSVLTGWAGYLLRVRPATRRGALVVADRWLYGYIGQPRPLRFAGPEFLARGALRVMPRPDVTVYLSAPAEVIVQRKRELTIGEVRAEQARWANLPVQRFLTVAAVDDPREIARRILEQTRCLKA